ncbi:hypothetical protein E2C01_026743 [Portunus trituberculatus]|uniref:Uncharacterized protein n=1 Tax=Portunus trituberculatus TaxID=210409 RepID=A0A5B7ELU4_PORTR|nr:hypothetical protein [Portunus trituberculatus]
MPGYQTFLLPGTDRQHGLATLVKNNLPATKISNPPDCGQRNEVLGVHVKTKTKEVAVYNVYRNIHVDFTAGELFSTVHYESVLIEDIDEAERHVVRAFHAALDKSCPKASYGGRHYKDHWYYDEEEAERLAALFRNRAESARLPEATKRIQEDRLADRTNLVEEACQIASYHDAEFTYEELAAMEKQGRQTAPGLPCEFNFYLTCPCHFTTDSCHQLHAHEYLVSCLGVTVVLWGLRSGPRKRHYYCAKLMSFVSIQKQIAKLLHKGWFETKMFTVFPHWEKEERTLGCGTVAGVGCVRGGMVVVVGTGRFRNMGVMVVVVVVVAVALGRGSAAMNDWGGWRWDVVRQCPLTELFFCDVMA